MRLLLTLPLLAGRWSPAAALPRHAQPRARRPPLLEIGGQHGEKAGLASWATLESNFQAFSNFLATLASYFLTCFNCSQLSKVDNCQLF